MNNIANERKKLGITQSALACACGWNQSRLANYEAGIRAPDLESCRSLVKALNKLGGKTNLDSLFPPRKKAA
ncbi:MULTISPECIES: helix-turn-helix domain-containing protein [Enterobacter cloacae complex]|jgi:putative transcriptional regulator|uniref:helix-turn-helix domain-containing protein n=1 Tax=Enterobacter cloacae complex TaxID=354276 RepID=UPI000940F011|nr:MULTISPECIES: helix-turn-helix transcriptional regulator [Enterobacter cloacae complex]MCK7176003.1 helix-turn-helix domain-containing protein [Enterobacter cloacae]RFF35230.1 XRE family transcriptional regulator [Enterobacter hormaechei]RFF35289.1 XRE family transcriptional regulator [Enterobacter hormaechei]HCR0385296.1 helix-turn-helix transcriptional regulator [Enterobacter kobei]